MKELKIYGGTYDGMNLWIVAAKSKRQAFACMKRAGFSGGYKSWDDFTSDMSPNNGNEIALKHPGQVFTSHRRHHSNAPFYRREMR